MRTNLFAFVLGSDNRKKVVVTLFAYPKRQWSCSRVEELTKLPHTTVFRALKGLRDCGLLKSTKINKKDILYELTESSLGKELVRILQIEEETAKNIAKLFVNKVKVLQPVSIILYGSAVKGDMKSDSDIDVLIIVDVLDREKEKIIHDVAAEISSKENKTISPTIMTVEEVFKEKNGQFIKSVLEHHKVLYGKEPF